MPRIHGIGETRDEGVEEYIAAARRRWLYPNGYAMAAWRRVTTGDRSHEVTIRTYIALQALVQDVRNMTRPDLALWAQSDERRRRAQGDA